MTHYEHFEGMFPSYDSTQLYFRFEKTSAPKALYVIAHGHGEHSGRYEEMIEKLKSRSFNIAAFDYRGQGRSEGKEVFVDSLADYVKDLNSFLEYLETKYGQKSEKFILYGNSLGALISVLWARQHGDRLKAMILSSPCLGLRLPNLLILFNRIMNRLAPGHIYRNPIYPPFLTHDPQEVEKYKKDLWVKRKITARLLNEMILKTRGLTEEAFVSIECPLYILMASEEKVVDENKTRVFFQKARSPDKELIDFPGFYHEIFHEKDRGKAFKSLFMCLDRLGL